MQTVTHVRISLESLSAHRRSLGRMSHTARAIAKSAIKRLLTKEWSKNKVYSGNNAAYKGKLLLEEIIFLSRRRGNGMSTIKDNIYKFLCNEGFRPDYDDDGDIKFNYEGSLHFIIFDEDDPERILLRKYLATTADDEVLELYRVINNINQRYKFGKCTLVEEKDDEGDTIMSLEIDTLESIDDFKKHFERYLRLIKQMSNDIFDS